MADAGIRNGLRNRFLKVRFLLEVQVDSLLFSTRVKMKTEYRVALQMVVLRRLGSAGP